MHQVIDKIVAEMGLPPSAALPSRETLRRFGNTSPASTFYILAHLESHVRDCPLAVQSAWGRHEPDCMGRA